MKIGLDAKRAFLNQTGLGNYARFVINGLLTYYPEHTYYLFTPKTSEAFLNELAPYKQVHIVTPQTGFGKLFPSYWRSNQLGEIAQSLALDVFHGLSNELPTTISAFSGKKVVTIHDLIFKRYPHYYKRIDRAIYERKFSFAANAADTVIATSRQTANDIHSFLQIPSEKVTVGYQNCSPAFGIQPSSDMLQRVREQYGLSQKFILSVGTIEARKNQLTLLKAFHQSQLEQVQLVFIGKETAYAEQLHAYIKAHGLQDRVLWLKNVGPSELPVIYKLAEVFVYISEFEGFGIPVLEALRAHTPVIAANTSSLPEVGGNFVPYIEPNDVSGLQALLETQFHHPKPIDKAGLHEHLSQFDTKALMAQLMTYYTS